MLPAGSRKTTSRSLRFTSIDRTLTNELPGVSFIHAAALAEPTILDCMCLAGRRVCNFALGGRNYRSIRGQIPTHICTCYFLHSRDWIVCTFVPAVLNSSAQLYRDLPTGPFYGFNRPGAKSSEAVIASWWRQGMMGGARAHYEGIVAFSQTDFTEDLKKITT